jgi:hypothetical protein
MLRLRGGIAAGEAGIARIGIARMDAEILQSGDASAKLAGWPRTAVLEGRLCGTR